MDSCVSQSKNDLAMILITRNFNITRNRLRKIDKLIMPGKIHKLGIAKVNDKNCKKREEQDNDTV